MQSVLLKRYLAHVVLGAFSHNLLTFKYLGAARPRLGGSDSNAMTIIVVALSAAVVNTYDDGMPQLMSGEQQN